MITVCCALWDANDASLPFSRHYTEEDVNKLYRGFARNLTMPWRMVCFSEKPRQYAHDIWQERLSASEPDYGSLIEPFRLNEASIICGLDTMVVGNCDHLAAYCIGGNAIAVPRDPFTPQKVCNGVALVPAGNAWVWNEFPGGNDMEWIRAQPGLAVLDDLFPGHVVSYKGHVQHYGLEDARIVYFHGHEKPHELTRLDWVREHWGMQ